MLPAYLLAWNLLYTGVYIRFYAFKQCNVTIWDHFCINHSFNSLYNFVFWCRFLTLLMLIIMVFFLVLFELVTLQNIWALEHNRSEIFHFKPKFFNSRKVWFSVRGNYSVPHSLNHAVILMYVANATLDQSWDLWSNITRDYSKKPFSRVKLTLTENQVFLIKDCDRLQGQFTSLHSLSKNGSSNVALGETIQSWHFVLRCKVAKTPWMTPIAITEYRSARSSQLFYAVPKIYILWWMNGLCRDGYIMVKGSCHI